MSLPPTETLTTICALVGLVVLGGCLVFHAAPTGDGELLATIVGALAGALTVGGPKPASKGTADS